MARRMRAAALQPERQAMRFLSTRYVVTGTGARPCAWSGAAGARLDDHVGVLLLHVDVRVKVRLARLNAGLDALQRVAALGHVALDLPRKLDLVADVQVDLEVDQLAHALVVEGVQALRN